MTTCKHCGEQLAPADLVRHEQEELLIVHCPNCRSVLGVYKRHSQRPLTDLLRH